MCQPVVTFGAVHVREFERVAGDHPDASPGPPLSLGWGYVEKEDTPVIDSSSNSSDSARKLAPLNAETRRFLLYHVFDVPKQDIEWAEEVAEETRLQRKESYWIWKQKLQVEEEDDEGSEEEEFPAELTVRHLRLSSLKHKSRCHSYSKPKRAFGGIFKGVRRSISFPGMRVSHVATLLSTTSYVHEQ
jgi:hypothetical protein